MRSPKGAKARKRKKKRSGKQMAGLTVSNFLGLLSEDPYDAQLVEGLRERLKGPEPANDGQEPLRLLEAARGAHERRGEFLAAAWLMELESDLVTDDPEFRSILMKELGRIRREELMDDQGALRAYEQLGGLESSDPEVAQAVDQLLQVEEKWRELAERFVEEARDAADPRLKTSLLTRAASLMWQYGGAEASDEADAVFDEALASDPSHMRTARQYALSLRARERWEDVVSVFMRAAEAARTREEKAAAWMQAARVLKKPLEDAEGAADAYRKALEFSPTDVEALSALVQHYTSLEAWDELARMYESALRSRQKLEDEKGMLLQLAMVHWRFREDPDAAEPFFARLRKIDAAHPGVLDFYRCQAEEGDPDGRLLTVLGDALRTATEPERQLALARELGNRAMTADRPERALEAWKLVERLEPGDEDARVALQQLYQRGGRWNALSESIRGEIDTLGPGASEEKLRLLRDLIPIYRDALQLDSMLIQVYGEILTVAPYDAEALDALVGLYESAGRWNDLIHVLDKKGDLADDTDEEVALRLRTAELWIERFGNMNQAIRPLERVVHLQPDHERALAELKDIFTKKRKWDSLYGVLVREAELCTDREALLDKHVEMAELCTTRLHDNAAAIQLWKGILEEAPERVDALDTLENLAEREKDWETLAVVLQSRCDACSNDAQKLDLLQRLGVIYAERLARLDDAVTAWQGVLALDPDATRVRRMLKDAYVASGDFEALEALYSEREDWTGLAEAFGQASEAAEDPALITHLALRAAALYRDALDDVSRASRFFERALSASPDNAEAAAGLAPAYARDHKWAEYARMLEIVAAAEIDEDIEARLERANTLRTVYLSRLKNPDASLGWATRAYLLAPGERSVVAGLEESAEAAGAHEDLVALFRDRLDHGGVDEVEALDLKRRIATISGERLGQSEESIRNLEAILEVKPNDAQAMAVLDRLYRAEKHFADLRALYERRLALVTDPAEEWVLLNEVAQVEEELLGDLPAAAERHWALIEKNPHDVDALRAVERLSQQLKQWDRLDAALERRLQSKVTDEDRLSVYLQLADLRRLHLESPGGALECYRAALALDGRNEVAIAGLEALSTEGGGIGVEAIDLLEPAYARRGHFDKLAGLLRKRLEKADDAEEIRTLRLRLAELSASELGDAAGAYRALESAFLDSPTDLDLFERLGGVAEAAGQHEAFAAALVWAIDAGGLDDVAEVAFSRRVAELYEVVLGTPEQAARFHRRVLRDEPLDTPAFTALKQLYTKNEQWDALRALYQQRIEATTNASAKLDLLLQLCFLFEEILDEPQQAIESYEQAVELDPGHTPSRRALQRLYARLNRWPELAELLCRDLDEAEGQEAIDLAYELATIFETKLDRLVDAVDHYERVLEASPTHLRAQEGLQRLIEQRPERQRIASILHPIFESQGAWGELAKVLEVELEDLTDPSSRAAHLTRIGELTETKLHDDAAAFDAYARAVREDAGDGSARADLSRLASKLGRHRERAELLEAGLATVDDDFLKTEILLELAELWDVCEPEPERAEKAYQQLVRFERDNPDIVLKASRALERLHRGAEDYGSLAKDLRRQIQFEEDESRRDELLSTLGELLEHTLHDPDSAIDVHRERLERDPTDADALGALERLYEQRGRWEPLIEVIERRIELSDVDEVERELLLRIADIYETKLDKIERATLAYRDVVSRFGVDPVAVAALTRIYRDGERWHELLDITEMRADVAETPEDRIVHAFEAAELMRVRTGDADRAFDAYVDLLSSAPGHEPTLGALEAMAKDGEPHLRVAAARTLLEQYRAQSRYPDQIRMLEVMAAGDDRTERVAALLRAAEVSELGTQRFEDAFSFTEKALREGVDLDSLERVLADYDRFTEETGRFSEQVATLAAIAPDVLDADLRIDVRMKAAGIAKERLGDTDFARAQYQRVLDEQPDHRQALDALLALVEGLGATRELVELLRRKSELCDDPEERAELLVRQAHLYQSELDDPELAIEALDRALSENEHPLAYEGLERLYRRTRKWEDLATLYEREIDQRIGDPAAVRYELGELCLRRLNEPWRALDQFGEALSQSPDHEPTIRALETLIEQSEYRSAAAELLEPIYLRRMEWAKVTQILEARLDGEEDPTQRMALLRHLGDVQESHLEDLDGALETYGRLFAEDPHDSHSQDTLTRLARSLGRWDRLAAIFDKILRAVEVDDADTAALALTTAKLYNERLEELDRAGYFYQRALTFDPSNKAAGAALASCYARSKRWEELLELDRERESFADGDDERVTLLHEVGRVEIDELGRTADAVQTYRRILEIDPTNEEAVSRLDALLEAAERWDDLAAHIEFQVDNAVDGAASIALRQRLGLLTEAQLGNAARALDIFEDVLADDGGFAPAVDAVTRHLDDEEHGPRAVQILEPIHREQDDWAALIPVLEHKAVQARDALDRAETWREVAQLQETRAGNGERAFAAWSEALTADPADESTQAAVDRLASALGNWKDYLETCEAVVEATDDPTLKGSFLRTIATTHDRRLGDPRAAIQSLRRMIEADPEAPGGLEDLEALQVMVGDWIGLAWVYERKLEGAVDPLERSELCYRLGGLFEEQLADPERAVSFFQQATDERPGDPAAYGALDRLFASQNDSERLADVLERRMEVEPEVDARVEVGMRLAELYEAQLRRPDAACDALRAVTEADPEHSGALEGLCRLFEREGRWQDLVDTLQRRADLAQSDSERVSLTHQLGNIMERELDDELSAIAVYGQVLRVDPTHEASVQALLRITKLADYREDAAAVVEPHLREQSRWNDLAALLRLRADAMTDPHQKAEQLVALADVHESGRRDPNGALDALLQSIGERPDDTEILDRAEGLSRSLQRWSDFVDVLFAEAGANLDPVLGAELYGRVARIAEEELKDSSKAIDANERALSLLGDDPAVLEALDRLFTQTEQWDRLHDVLSRRIDTGNVDRTTLLVRQGRVRAGHLGDFEGALGAYQQAMEQDPGRDEALAAVRNLASRPEVAGSAIDLLEEYYRGANDLEQVVALYEQRVALAPNDADRVALLVEAAELWEHELERPDEALRSIRRAVALDPRDATLLEALERLAEAGEGWRELDGLVEEIAAHGDLDRRDLYELRLRSVGWYRDRLGDVARAEQALTDAIPLDPEPIEAHAQLVDLLRAQARPEALVSALRAWGEVEPVAETRIALLREAGDLARHQVGDANMAADQYQALLSVDREDVDALRSLAEIRMAQSRWNEAVGLLERQLDVAPGGERSEVARAIGAAYRDHLEDPRAAINAYETALDIDDTDVETMDALEGLYRDNDRIEALRSLLERRAEQAVGPDRTALQLRLAQLYEHAFRDQSAAIATFRQVLDAEPDNAVALSDLERLFEATEAWDDLVTLLLSKVDGVACDAQRTTLQRIAVVHEEKQGDVAGAIRTYERIDADLGADETSLRALARLYEREGRWDDVARTLRDLSTRLDGDDAIELCHRVVNLFERELQDEDEAGRVLEATYERFPEDEKTRSRLKAHYEARDDFRALAQVLDAELGHAGNDADRVALLRQISDVYRDRLDDPGTAAGYLERAVRLDGSDRGALVPLCDLYMAAGRAEDAVPILQRIIESFGKQRSKELAGHYHRLGQALAGMGDAAGALQAYDAAFKIDLTNVAILRDLGRLTHQNGDLDRAQKSFRALLLQRLDDDSGIQKADVYYYLGDIASKQGDPRKAITMLERALAEDRGHAQASELLAQLKG
jgi:tetratricopeptide (TPR) repeat protein